MKLSIIICTHNQLASLRETMAALAHVRVPDGDTVEVLLVENACSDGTTDFVEDARLPHLQCRALHEPARGQVRARNCGLAAAQGEVIIFTDDDVRPMPDWLEKITAHMRSRKYDALIGCVRLAPYLERPWLTRQLRAGLAASEGLEDGWLTEMIGANMAFHRRVLERVPEFDEELGPGAMGFGDDTLFSWQLEAAGFRLGRAPDAVVEHHCEENRLLRSHILQSAVKSGKGQAYLLHHWHHTVVSFPRIRLVWAMLKLVRRFVISRADTRLVEGCASWEVSLTQEIARLRHYLVESRRPRNYAKRGLVKLRMGEFGPAEGASRGMQKEPHPGSSRIT